MKKEKIGRIVSSTAIVLAALVCIGIPLGFYISSHTAYPQPEYSVDSYEELGEKLDAAPEEFIMPAKIAVLDEGVSGEFTVLLKDRFNDDPSGYAIWVTNTDGDTSVTCQLLSEFDTVPTYTADTTYEGVGLGLSEYEGRSIIVFIYRDCYYTIDAYSQDRGQEIARSIIDQAG